MPNKIVKAGNIDYNHIIIKIYIGCSNKNRCMYKTESIRI